MNQGCFGRFDPLPVTISDYRMSSVIRLRTFPSKTTLGRTHGAPYRGYGYVPLRFGGNVVRRMGTQQQQQPKQPINLDSSYKTDLGF